MRTRAEIEAEIEAADWKLTAGPTRTAYGFKATIERGSVSVIEAGSEERELLESLLRYAQAHSGDR